MDLARQRSRPTYTRDVLDPILNTCSAARRAALSARLGAVPALITAGRARSRNYAANTFPFRASSHFLYLVGLPLEGAGVWLDGGQVTLLVQPEDPDDALWHGAQPGSAELASALGLAVAPWSDLAALRRGREVATLGEGDLVGETAILRRSLRTASIVALTPLELIHFTKEQLDQLNVDMPSFHEALEKTAAERFPKS